ncbi:MAG: SDR family oxidoreductase [Burkholderiaceae bacterium]
MQRVFITGASGGIGAALAMHYAKKDACLALVGRRLPQLQALLASLPNPSQHRVYALDVTDHVALARAASDFIAVYDGIDVVIANAGVSQGTLSEHLEDLPVFERIVATNLTAVVATFSPFIATMKAQRQGRPPAYPMRLVAISSLAGIRGIPGASAYCASKTAVIGYCESLRIELRGTGIRVVTILPGFIDTAMTRVNQYRMPFLMKVDRFAARVVEVIEVGSSYRVIPWQMGITAKLLRILPNWLYDRVFAKVPHKARVVAQLLPRVDAAPPAGTQSFTQMAVEVAASDRSPPGR